MMSRKVGDGTELAMETELSSTAKKLDTNTALG